MSNSEHVNVDQASPARVYDSLLGGKDNFAVDRAAVQAVLAVDPRAAVMPRHNRDFLGRAVRELAHAGFDQFLDIGSGLPTVGNVHEIAQAVNPQAHVVYVDNDPLTHNHAVALLDGCVDRCAFVLADARSPEQILNAPETRRLIDFTRPVAVLTVAVLHFVADAADPAGIVRALMGPAAPGSVLVLSHLTSEGMPKVMAEKLIEVYGDGPAPLYPRSREEIAALFGDLDLVGGLEDVQRWHNDDPAPLEEMRLLCGVAAKTTTTKGR